MGYRQIVVNRLRSFQNGSHMILNKNEFSLESVERFLKKTFPSARFAQIAAALVVHAVRRGNIEFVTSAALDEIVRAISHELDSEQWVTNNPHCAMAQIIRTYGIKTARRILAETEQGFDV